jgi:hypothetical protein
MANQYNPYQPPGSEQILSTPTGDFDIGRAIREGFDDTKRHAGVAIAAMLVGGLCTLLSAVTVIGYFVVVPVLGWGMIRFLLNLHDGTARVSDIFSGFSRYGAVLGRFLLIGLVLMVAGLMSESVVFVGQYLKSGPLQLLGWLIYLVAFVLVLSRLYFALFFAVDKDMAALEALSASWEATRGKGLKVAALLFVSGVFGMLGALALCIGLLFTLPMSYAMFVSAYRQMVGEAPSQRAPDLYGGPRIQ